MLSFIRKIRAARISLASGVAVALGTSALVLFTGAAPALATASDCHNTGTGYAAAATQLSDGNWSLAWYQVWYKQSRAYCKDFYLTYQGAHATYRGFYKSVSDPEWFAGLAGPKTLNAGSDGNQGVDMVADILVGTQLNIGTSAGGQYVTVAF